MKDDTLFFIDGDGKTDLSEDLRARLREVARGNGHGVREIELKKDDIPSCLGCLRCITKHPGRCVHHESLAGIIERASGCSAAVFLTPARFGTYSSSIKNVVDRSGFFIDNHGHCRKIVIGYAEEANDEERSTFLDITVKHRGQADIVHLKVRETIDAFFTRSREDNTQICGLLERVV
jgi:multimeric flavodoxin WrbA